MENVFQWIPPVDELLAKDEIVNLSDLPRPMLLDIIRSVLAQYRQELAVTSGQYPNQESLREAIIGEIKTFIKKKAHPELRPVINATGVVLHTNLGRAVLSEAARQSIDMVAGSYSNLEIDLDSGQRGSRYSHVKELMIKLTGAESCLVVNNNAAAVLLALDTLAKGKSAIVSRGELVEIGGAFRVPEIMEKSGARLVEVGTTNKTYARDFEREITAETGLLLKVHTSNYRIVGFTHEPALQELVELGEKYQIPVMEDLGSGCLFDLKAAGVGDEPTVQQVVSRGLDVVTFSGDKLLGGPQAGVIVGKGKYIALMEKNPLTRALRIDKMTIAALEATLRSYLDQDRASREVPTIEMLTMPFEAIKDKAHIIKNMIQGRWGHCLTIETEAGLSQVGGGSLPGVTLPTCLIIIKPKRQTVDDFAATLRKGNPAVLTYIREDQVVLDPRTIFPSQYELLLEAFSKVCGGV